MGWVVELATKIEDYVLRSHTHQELLIHVVVTLLVLWITRALMQKARRDDMLADVPKPPGSLPLFGHALQLGAGSPWEVCHDFIKKYGDPKKREHGCNGFLARHWRDYFGSEAS